MMIKNTWREEQGVQVRTSLPCSSQGLLIPSFM